MRLTLDPLRVELPPLTIALEADFDESKHPRDNHGRFGSKDEDRASIKVGDTDIAINGTPDGKGTPDDPIYTNGDLDRAMQLLGEGKHVRLDDNKQASVLVEKLGVYARELKAQGERAGTYDLCSISVAGSNIFCHDNLGIPRVEMPQLKGEARDGSKAADLRADKSDSGESVSIEQPFTDMLRASGVGVVDKTVDAGMLRPTQSQINGAQAGVILQKTMNDEFTGSKAIWTTQDGYILDGHHRYVADVAHDLLTGGDGHTPIEVHEVQMDIGAALDTANAFADHMGLVSKSVAASAGAPVAAEFEEDLHPRDNHGRFGSKDEPDAPKADLLTRWGDGDGSKAVKAEMFKTGEELMGLTGVKGAVDEKMASDLKAGVAHDVAARMQSSTADMITATLGPEQAAHLGDHDWVAMSESPGFASMFKASEFSPENLALIEAGKPLGDSQGDDFLPGSRAYRADDPRADVLMREDVAGRLVSQWAGTSNDSNASSLAMQEAATAEFGLKGAAGWPPAEADGILHDDVTARYAQAGDVYRDFLRSQYDSTQGYLKGEGISELTVARGWSWDDASSVPDWAHTPTGEPRVESIDTRPLSSWTTRSITAQSFGLNSEHGATTYQTVPADRILSIPLTGLGCLEEREVVVLGGPVDAVVTKYAAVDR